MQLTKFYKNISLISFAILLLTCSKDSETQESVKENVAPNAFSLSAVENGAAEVSLSPSFSWQKANDADGDAVTYDFYLDTNTAPTTKLGSDLSGTSYNLSSELLNNTTYYWSVTAKDTQGNATSSSVFSFTTIVNEVNSAPAAFNLLAPENESQESGITPTFTWETAIDPEGDTVTYEFYLDTTDNPATKLEEGLTEATYAITAGLMYETTYFWKVVAIDSNDNSVESQTFNFTTSANPPPVVFNLLQVEDEAVAVSLFPTFSWTAASDDGTVTYDLYLSLDETPELFQSNITETRLEVTTKLFLNQTYYWKVIAKDNSGNETESETFSFTTQGLRLSASPETTSAGFSPRAWHTSVVFNDKMWVIGGYDGNGARGNGTFYNDVWSSSDGINWTLETNNAGFSGRYDHASIVYDNKIWVVGGKAFDVPGIASNAAFVDINDVWSSSDGINWTQITDNAPFSKRGGHTLDVYNGRLHLISGGFNSFGTEEVWSTENGLTWTLETDNLAFDTSRRHNHRVVSLNDTFYMTGGATINYDGIWRSNNLKDWTLVKDNLDFLARRAPSFHNYGNNLVYFGGLEPNKSFTTPSAYRQDIWYSVDGENWTQGREQAPFLERYQHTSVIFDNKIFIIGGQNPTGYLNDVWTLE